MVKINYEDEFGIMFDVPSSSRDEVHLVNYDREDGWWCSCEDYTYRKRFCKHMKEAFDYVAENREDINIISKKVFTGKSIE